MQRVRHFCRNAGWFGSIQTSLVLAMLVVLAIMAARAGNWLDPSIWSPPLFLATFPLIRTRTIAFHMDWLNIAWKGGDAVLLALIAIGGVFFQSRTYLWQVIVPAAWLFQGLTFWLLSHPGVVLRPRSRTG